MNHFRYLFVFLTYLASNNSYSSEVTRSCGSIDGVKGAEYCVTQISNKKPQTALYFLHGMSGNVESWSHGEGQALTTEILKRGIEAPLILTISFGPAWFLSDEPPLLIDTQINSFIEKAIPWLEQKMDFKPSKRLLLGFSMGGYNAIQIFNRKPELFSKVALGCPAIPSVSPHSSALEIIKYIQRTGANEMDVAKGLVAAREFFPTEESWQKVNPLNKDTRNQKGFPEIFISAASHDGFGFQEGNLMYAQNLEKQGQSVKWSLINGRHCEFNPREIIDFLFQ